MVIINASEGKRLFEHHLPAPDVGKRHAGLPFSVNTTRAKSSENQRRMVVGIPP
jgi:hypothetical protein